MSFDAHPTPGIWNAWEHSFQNLQVVNRPLVEVDQNTPQICNYAFLFFKLDGVLGVHGSLRLRRSLLRRPPSIWAICLWTVSFHLLCFLASWLLRNDYYEIKVRTYRAQSLSGFSFLFSFACLNIFPSRSLAYIMAAKSPLSLLPQHPLHCNRLDKLLQIRTRERWHRWLGMSVFTTKTKAESVFQCEQKLYLFSKEK